MKETLMTRQSLMRAALIASAGAVLVGAGYFAGVRHATSTAPADAISAARISDCLVMSVSFTARRPLPTARPDIRAVPRSATRRA
ncbi:hypothetical protein A8D69_31485 [Burkholderia cenocepacia]|nr:hypothetical protein A8D69_31485 [Burkholderia cenocepacia]